MLSTIFDKKQNINYGLIWKKNGSVEKDQNKQMGVMLFVLCVGQRSWLGRIRRDTAWRYLFKRFHILSKIHRKTLNVNSREHVCLQPKFTMKTIIFFIISTWKWCCFYKKKKTKKLSIRIYLDKINLNKWRTYLRCKCLQTWIWF